MLIGNRIHDAEIKKHSTRYDLPAHGARDGPIDLTVFGRATAILEMIVRPPDADSVWHGRRPGAALMFYADGDVIAMNTRRPRDDDERAY